MRDAFVASQAGTGIPILEAKNLKSLTEPGLQPQLREAAESWEPVKLDLGAGEREYDVRSDKAGNLRIEDSDSVLYDIKPQTISLNSHGNRVLLSTLSFDGDDTLVQEMRMNLTGSGNFYCSEERLGLNAHSMTEPHTSRQIDSFYRDSQI